MAMNGEILQKRAREEALYRRYQVVRSMEGRSGFLQQRSWKTGELVLHIVHALRSLFASPQQRHHG